MKAVLLALDQGSSSSRAVAWSAGGRVLARAQAKVAARYPRAGWVEHDALELARSQERTLDAVLARLPKGAPVAALGATSQRSTVVLWDARTGKPVAPAPSWQDGRAAEVAGALQDRQAWAHERTGLYLTPYYSAPKIRWLLDHVPAAARAADAGALRIGPVATYVLWRLSGGELFISDPTLAQRTLLFNLRTSDWDLELLKLFGVDRAWLPAIVPSAGELGVLRRGGRDLPVRALLGDQQAAAAGLGAARAGAGVLNYGTGAFFLLHTGAEQHRVAGLLTSVAWRKAGRPCEFFLEGTVHAAGTSFDWLKERLRLLDSVHDLDAAMRRSAHRVLALPAIGGLGAPRWDYRTRTAFVGLSSQSSRDDLVRGVAEGIAFLLNDIVAACRAAGLPIRQVRASGGLSRSSRLLQFQADLLGLGIDVAGEREATALGTAMMAAEAAGVRFTPRASKGASFAPKMSPAKAESLVKAWRLFVDAQQALGRQLDPLGVFE